MADVVVIQSHRSPLPAPWYDACIASVSSWAAGRGFAYRWLGDELFAPLAAELRARLAARPVIASDLARLLSLRSALEEGFAAAIWMDADTLVLRPEALEVPPSDHAFGREVWVQQSAKGRLRSYEKIHNAFLKFAAGNPVLEFYIYAASRLLERHRGPMVPQLIGPKFLATLDNIIEFPVLEEAAVLSPLVIEDLLAGGGPALELFLAGSRAAPAAVNLCGSMVAAGELSDEQMSAVISLLTAAPECLVRGPRERAG